MKETHRTLETLPTLSYLHQNKALQKERTAHKWLRKGLRAPGPSSFRAWTWLATVQAYLQAQSFNTWSLFLLGSTCLCISLFWDTRRGHFSWVKLSSTTYIRAKDPGPKRRKYLGPIWTYRYKNKLTVQFWGKQWRSKECVWRCLSLVKVMRKGGGLFVKSRFCHKLE